MFCYCIFRSNYFKLLCIVKPSSIFAASGAMRVAAMSSLPVVVALLDDDDDNDNDTDPDRRRVVSWE
jgi:hypothetical protein